ncbi:hypothetical protein [Streptomyces sp. ISL-86]|uniref:hypothetical protein n=1 Tax=Streptomyces sp. ISL-86 TaxID=2819187 RepID=UPI001BE751DB|nr:hypothetical protein [Streptomyces sp. ISL-86]MBT2460003.1 hypothetical protein [Streptomyces sp. ISL-86]
MACCPPRGWPSRRWLHDVDSDLGAAWDTAAGVRTRRRPLPKQMVEERRTVGRGRYRTFIPADPEPPPLEARLEQAWALARAVAGHVSDGTLRRAPCAPRPARTGDPQDAVGYAGPVLHHGGRNPEPGATRATPSGSRLLTCSTYTCGR